MEMTPTQNRKNLKKETELNKRPKNGGGKKNRKGK